ncbi:MAG: ABC transporter permease [Chloroflexi bacterium]|nr:ABC transporter permease [Chloroflexota bacterium]
MVDQDQSPLSAAFVNALVGQQPSLVICPQENDAEDVCALGSDPGVISAEDAQSRLDQSRTLAYLVIDAGFGEALRANQAAHITYRSGESMTAESIAQQAVGTAAQRVEGIVSAEQARAPDRGRCARRRRRIRRFDASERRRARSQSPVTIHEEVAPVEKPDFLVGLQQSVPGIGSMYVMFLILAGASTLVQERRLWTLQRLSAAPVTKADIILGKLLARFALGMIQYGVAFAVGLTYGRFLNVSFGDNPVALLIVMVAFSLCVSTFTLFMATLVKTEDQASSLVVLVTLALAPIGGAWWSLDLEFIPGAHAHAFDDLTVQVGDRRFPQRDRAGSRDRGESSARRPCCLGSARCSSCWRCAGSG